MDGEPSLQKMPELEQRRLMGSLFAGAAATGRSTKVSDDGTGAMGQARGQGRIRPHGGRHAKT
jgi:hypothetical protein